MHWRSRSYLARLAAGGFLAAMLLPHAVGAQTQGADIAISSITGSFFPNPSNSATFSASPTTPVAFTMVVPNINFNPPAGTVPCSNATGVDVRTRPFTDVIPEPDGSCRTIVAQGSSQQAGVGSLYNFNAVFTGSFSITSAMQVTFDFFSDDGWILSIGPNADGLQPHFISGQLLNQPPTGPFTRLPVVGAFNVPSPPSANPLVVDFPAAGTYEFELDYTECCTGELALTLTANGRPIRNVAQPTVSVPASPTPPPVDGPSQDDGGNIGPVIAVVAVVAALGIGILDNFRRKYG